jgi:hypothetical protein
LYMVLVLCTMNLTKLIAVTATCPGATQEANNTAVLLHWILVLRPVHLEVKAEFQTFSQQVLPRKLQFTPCGLFPIDYTLRLSLAGAVTTYLIILIQHCAQGTFDFTALCNTTIRTTV